MIELNAEVYTGRSKVKDVETKRLAPGYNFDQIAVGGEAIAWLLLSAE